MQLSEMQTEKISRYTKFRIDIQSNILKINYQKCRIWEEKCFTHRFVKEQFWLSRLYAC